LSRLLDRRRPALVLAAVAVLAGALIGASRLSSPAAPAASPTPERPFAGIPQAGVALGSPSAPVTLVEYADPQCPYCAEWSRRTLPVLVERYVRPGKLRIVFRGLAFAGPDSEQALRVALAAAGRNRLWDVVDGLYRRQAAENSGWVTDGLLEELAGPHALHEGDTPRVDRMLADARRAAAAGGIAGTPAFQIESTGGRPELVHLESLEPLGLIPAIDAALAA
jgi:protein-disulfide isomerase